MPERKGRKALWKGTILMISPAQLLSFIIFMLHISCLLLTHKSDRKNRFFFNKQPRTKL